MHKLCQHEHVTVCAVDASLRQLTKLFNETLLPLARAHRSTRRLFLPRSHSLSLSLSLPWLACARTSKHIQIERAFCIFRIHIMYCARLCVCVYVWARAGEFCAAAATSTQHLSVPHFFMLLLLLPPLPGCQARTDAHTHMHMYLQIHTSIFQPYVKIHGN